MKKMTMKRNIKLFKTSFIALCAILLITNFAFARDVEYKGTELDVFVSPGEPTQVQFPSKVLGGFKKKLSAISLDKKGYDLVIFATEQLTETGESMIIRLDDGRSYTLRVKKANATNKDTLVRIIDKSQSILTSSGAEIDESNNVKDPQLTFAPPTQVSGLMREMILASEFGKGAINGYRATDKYRGETVINDGAIHATIDTIFIGTNLWGYVLDVKNLLDVSQKLNPATFRLDGTRAISFEKWELSPQPLNIEEQIAKGHKTKVYIVTRAR
ncbi:MAG: hypothetical protein PUH01_04970 [Pseudomonadota bacterium]|nr:hypothetical protein [Pseudomonadota bacterium]